MAFDPRTITRPDRTLLTYYTWVALATVVGFPFAFAAYWFRYRSLRYRFDDDGLSMSWGILFHKEIHLTYRRIQDIHVTRNLLQRWLGLASVEIQTASGTSGAEMTIEGILEPDALRDFLYSKMRGARDEPPAGVAVSVPGDEALTLLREIRDALVHRKGVAGAGQLDHP